MCFGCGRRNRRGLKLRFRLDAQARRIRARWKPSAAFQGYARLTHGGMVALILDEAMVNLLWKLGEPAVTAEMSVRFLRPAPVGAALAFEAWIARRSGRLFRMEAEARDEQGRAVARGQAKCVRLRA